MAIDDERNRVLTALRDQPDGANSSVLGEHLGLVREVVEPHLLYCADYGLELSGLLGAVPASWTRESVGPETEWQPPVEVFENAHEVVIKAALPNVDPKQVDITITNDAVTFKGIPQ